MPQAHGTWRGSFRAAGTHEQLGRSRGVSRGHGARKRLRARLHVAVGLDGRQQRCAELCHAFCAAHCCQLGAGRRGCRACCALRLTCTLPGMTSGSALQHWQLLVLLCKHTSLQDRETSGRLVGALLGAPASAGLFNRGLMKASQLGGACRWCPAMCRAVPQRQSCSRGHSIG